MYSELATSQVGQFCSDYWGQTTTHECGTIIREHCVLSYLNEGFCGRLSPLAFEFRLCSRCSTFKHKF